VNLYESLKAVQPGDVLVVGEKHGFYPHHQNQSQVISILQDFGHSVHLGFEHMDYTKQGALADYLNGSLSEPKFLKKIGWGKSQFSSCYEYTESVAFNGPFSVTPFSCYRQQLWLPGLTSATALAINLPRRITNKVFREGVGSLTSKELNLLPPNYELGNDLYFERFKAVISGSGGSHGPISDEVLEKMFWAQSLWDETMAWKTLEFLQGRPSDVVVIIVGDFHAAYGGGLPDRLMARGASKVHVISQMLAEDLKHADIKAEVLPDPKYGERGDLVIFTNFRQ
jgi:uncharacterized iron-regulated protein